MECYELRANKNRKSYLQNSFKESHSCDACQVIDPYLHNVNYSNGSTIIQSLISLFLILNRIIQTTYYKIKACPPKISGNSRVQGKFSLNRGVRPEWRLGWGLLIINQQIKLHFLFCLGICCSHYFKHLDNVQKNPD